MKTKDIKVNGIYNTRDGDKVRVAEIGTGKVRDRLPSGQVSVWEKDSQEPYLMATRDLVSLDTEETARWAGTHLAN